MTRVKICGITNLEDALLAAELGADELGFNFFAGSTRFIMAAECGRILSKLPRRVATVGVFVNEPVDRVCQVAVDLGLNVIQVHGDESSSYIDELRRRTRCRLTKAIRVGRDFDAADISGHGADSVLLDVKSDGGYGGTGRIFDWNLARDAKTFAADLYVAGGLTPENVSNAIGAISPDAVDTASGVESAPGKKDPEKVRRFIAAAKAL